MEKSLHFLVVLLLAIFLSACNIQTVEKFEQMQEQERSVNPQPTTEQEQTSSVDNETAEQLQETEGEDKDLLKVNDKELQQTEEQKAQQEANEVKQKPKQEDEKKQEVTKSPSSKTEQTTTKHADNKQKTNTATQTIEKQQQPAPQKRTVTIAIRVDTLLKHWDKLEPSLQSEKYVPKNGVILKATKYELLSEKETVWDVLQRATKEHKIQMEYQGANENIYNSVYIEGINHLYEFSAGELSGWMYKVNGVYPNYGCSQYVLKDGDVIEWNYTVDLGRDLGHYWDGNE